MFNSLNKIRTEPTNRTILNTLKQMLNGFEEEETNFMTGFDWNGDGKDDKVFMQSGYDNIADLVYFLAAEYQKEEHLPFL